MLYYDRAHKGRCISPLLYGAFFEDINYGGDGGLYGELIANRSFEYYDREKKEDLRKLDWETSGSLSFSIETAEPINGVHKNCAVLVGRGTLKNVGYGGEGFGVREGERLTLSLYLKGDAVNIKITDRGGRIYAETRAKSSETWQKTELSLTSQGTAKNASLEIEVNGKTELGLVSLFGETYKDEKNGFRRDIADMIADLKPGFLRFPGGCVVEGRSFDEMYNWKDTVGDIETRRTNVNRWQIDEYQREGRSSKDYFQSYGIGFFEYFRYCEDIGAEPVPVINCGMTCQWHEALTVPLDTLKPFVDDALDLIEFANGGAGTPWGGVRTAMGHEEPFNLKYLAIGNEQWGEEYFERYEIFRREIGRAHPEIKLITSAGWKQRGWEFDLAYDKMKKNPDMAYAVDEHFYKEPEWFINNTDRYDSYDRRLPKVLIGEYAAHTDSVIEKRRNTWYAALCEAAFLTGVEKNADHVVMTCYAPLLAKAGHWQWQPNLIWFDNLSVYGSPSYYMLKIMSESLADYNIECGANEENLFACAGEREGKLILKIVNLAPEKRKISLPEKIKGRAVSISAPPEAENSFAEPKRVYPQKAAFDGSELGIDAYSVTIITED